MWSVIALGIVGYGTYRVLTSPSAQSDTSANTEGTRITARPPRPSIPKTRLRFDVPREPSLEPPYTGSLLNPREEAQLFDEILSFPGFIREARELDPTLFYGRSREGEPMRMMCNSNRHQTVAFQILEDAHGFPREVRPVAMVSTEVFAEKSIKSILQANTIAPVEVATITHQPKPLEIPANEPGLLRSSGRSDALLVYEAGFAFLAEIHGVKTPSAEQKQFWKSVLGSDYLSRNLIWEATYSTAACRGIASEIAMADFLWQQVVGEIVNVGGESYEFLPNFYVMPSARYERADSAPRITVTFEPRRPEFVVTVTRFEEDLTGKITLTFD